MNRHSKLWQTALLLGIVLLGLLSLFLWKTDALHRIKDLEHISEYLGSYAPWSQLVFFLLQLSSVILAPIPSNAMAMAGGACFGLVQGFSITFCAVTLGSMTTFTLARILGREWAMRLVSRRLSRRYQELLTRKRDTFLVLVFLFPFFPDDIICILAGLTDIPLRRFFLIVLLTRHWGLLAASAAGSSLFCVPSRWLVLLGAGGVLLFLLGVRYGEQIENRLLTLMKK